jgi:hypothetical protein
MPRKKHPQPRQKKSYAPVLPLYDPRFFLRIPFDRSAFADDDDLRKFRAPRSGAAEVIYNRSKSRPYVTRSVSIAEIHEIVGMAERDAISAYWKGVLLEWVPNGAKLDFRSHRSVNTKIQRSTTAGAQAGCLYGLLDRYKKGGSLLNTKYLVDILNGYEPQEWSRRQGDLTLAEVKTLDLFLGRPAADQRKFLLDRMPGSLDELRPWLRPCGPNRRQFVCCSPSATGIVDAREWIARLCSFIAKRDAGQDIILPLLIGLQLRNRGIVLWHGAFAASFRLSQTRGVGRGGALEYLTESLKKKWPVLSDAKHANPSARQRFQSHLVGVYLRTSLNHEEDISWDFARGMRSVQKEFSQSSGSFILNLEHAAVIHDPDGYKIAPKEDYWVSAVVAAFGTLESRPRLEPWRDLIVSYRQKIDVKKLKSRVSYIRPFIEWLVTYHDAGYLPRPPEIRREHVRDDARVGIAPALSLWESLTNRRSNEKPLEGKNLNRYWFEARNVFDHLATKDEEFKNPILEADRFAEDRRPKSPHLRVPSTMLADIRRFIVKGDGSGAPIGWASHLETLPHCQAKVRLGGGVQQVFCPVLPAVLWLMCQWPLRSSQVRWLDSGELDQLIYDFSKRQFVPNSIGVVGRAFGVVAPADDVLVGDAFGKDHHADFRVIRNKRLKSDRSEYTIPYMDGETAWIIQQVVDWQRKYGGKPTLVKESQAEKGTDRDGDDNEIVALFRLPRNKGIFPVSYDQLLYFWESFCVSFDELHGSSVCSERLVADVSKVELKTGIHKGRYRTVVKTVYDLHGFRVGGVSERVERGLPLALIGAICGHRSTTMTFHYFRADRALMRQRMSDLLRNNPTFAAQAAKADRLIRGGDPETLSRLHGDIALLKTHLAAKAGVRIDTRGICPGTSCAEGLKESRVSMQIIGSLVPESLCPLCQFWITGFMFLPGMVKWLNELLEQLEWAYKRQLAILSSIELLDRQGGQDGEISALRSESERIDQSSLARGAAAARLYELIIDLFKSDAQRDAAGTPRDPLALTVAGGSRVMPVIERCSRFDKLREMSLMDHLLPSQSSELAEKVASEFTLDHARALGEFGAARLLIGLPQDLQKSANIALCDLLVRAVPNGETIDDVYEGHKRFRDVLTGEACSVLAEGICNAATNLERANKSDLQELRRSPENMLRIPKLVQQPLY